MNKKINVKVFKDVELEDLKLTYYGQVVRYHLHEHTWLEIFHAYQAMSDAPSLVAEEASRLRNVKLQTLYLVLSPLGMDQIQAMRALSKEKALLDLPLCAAPSPAPSRPLLAASARALPLRRAPHRTAPAPQRAARPAPRCRYKELLKLFITKEIFHFAELEAKLRAELGELGELGEFPPEEVTLMLETLHSRVTQHNIEVVSTYYERVTMERLAELLGLGLAQMETQLSEMVTKKQVYARIDRPRGIIVFSPPKTANELLNDWSGDVSTLLNLLESTCHLVQKDMMVHKVA